MKPIKALFLDRDGIINIDKNYLHKIEDFEFIEGIFELVKLFVEKNYTVFIVTNQSGIGRGYYTIKDFEILMRWVKEEFKKREINIEKTLFCPHKPTDECLCRKPRTKLIDDVLKEYDIDLKNSFMFGDKQSDIDLANNSSMGFSVAISLDKRDNSSYSFKSIKEALKYFQKNPQKILK